MNHVLSSHEILGTIVQGKEELEVVASAEAGYDSAASHLQVVLDSFLRPVDIRHRERRLPAGWLPLKQTVTEGVDRGESSDLARDIFHRWVSKVRHSIPSTLHEA